MQGFPQTEKIIPERAVRGPYVIVDVRSPKEFADGSVPGAINLPLLDDRQRAEVGIAYQKEGSRQARFRAVDAVSGGLPFYLRSIETLSQRGRDLVVMCWRGGERSRNVILLLGLVGVRARQMEGGYKAYRRWVLDALADWQPERPVVTLHGHTGVGKTAVLRALQERAPQLSAPVPDVLDLEGLALHRGSLLGGLNQPGRRGQRDFDSMVWERLDSPAADYWIVEGEGGKIGGTYVPPAVQEMIRNGLPVLLRDEMHRRVDRILREYAPGEWTEKERENFRSGLEIIGKRISAEEMLQLRTDFEDGRFKAVVEKLLVTYYDPLYERSSVGERKFSLVLDLSGDPDEDGVILAEELRPLIQSWSG